MTILALLNKAKTVRPEAIIKLSLSKTKNDLVEINQERMLAGKRADGSVMPDYSIRSVTEFGKEPGPIKLLDTSDFQQNIFVEIEGNDILTKSRDSKNDMLVNEYGDIFGTYGPYKREYVEVLQPVLVNEFKIAHGL